MKLDDIQAGRGGVAASLARAGLWLCSLPWALVQTLKSFAYRVGLRRSQRVERPVISIGNIAVGGTGKTPFVVWLARQLADDGRRVGILARGYGGTVSDGFNDEGLLLRRALGADVPQVQDPDRVAGAARLLRDAPQTEVLLLDDGFQHRRIARDVDVVLIDATCPFGYGHLLPRGRLRERPAALRRAGAIVITRSDAVDESELVSIESTIRAACDAPIARAQVVPTTVEAEAASVAAETLRGRPVFACCGIGNPAAFRKTLEGLGARVVGERAFADHRVPPPAAWPDLVRDAKKAGAEQVVITRKDAVKLDPLPDGVAVLDVELRIVAGEEELLRVVRGALP